MLFRTTLLVATLLHLTSIARSQADDVETDSSSQPQTKQNAELKSDETTGSSGSPTTNSSNQKSTESFQLPASDHAWTRFKPGAWRETQTLSTTLDSAGNVVNQSFTNQKETLDAVADGKYVLKVQTTLEVGGKQIVGKETTRVLHLETDGGGALSETVRSENQSLTHNGRKIECQVWQLHYQDGVRTLHDTIHYSAKQFPHVLARETAATNAKPELETSSTDDAQTDSNATSEVQDPSPTNGQAQATPANNERKLEVIALETPFLFNGQVLNCTAIRTVRTRAKGGSVRLATIHKDIPGGELHVSTNEFDATGNTVRFSLTKLLAYQGEFLEDAPAAPTNEEVSPKKPDKS